MYESLLAAEPKSTGARYDLLTGQADLAMAHDLSGHAEEAEAGYARVIAGAEAFVADNPEDAQRSDFLATKWFAWGRARQRAKRYDDAIDAYRRAKEIFDRLKAAKQFREGRAPIYRFIGENIAECERLKNL